MPGLEENLPSFAVHRIGDLLPRVYVTFVGHHRRIVPFNAMGRDQSRLDDDHAHPVSRPISVIADGGVAWLPINTAIPGESSHADSITERQGTIAQRGGFENLGNDHC